MAIPAALVFACTACSSSSSSGAPDAATVNDAASSSDAAADAGRGPDSAVAADARAGSALDAGTGADSALDTGAEADSALDAPAADGQPPHDGAIAWVTGDGGAQLPDGEAGYVSVGAAASGLAVEFNVCSRPASGVEGPLPPLGTCVTRGPFLAPPAADAGPGDDAGPPPSCGEAYGGLLQITGSSSPITVSPIVSDAGPYAWYEYDAPDGGSLATDRPLTVTVAAGGVVPPLSVDITIPNAIQVTAPTRVLVEDAGPLGNGPRLSAAVDPSRSLAIAWNGGEGGAVRVRIDETAMRTVSGGASSWDVAAIDCLFPASAMSATIPASAMSLLQPTGGDASSDTYSATIDVDSETAASATVGSWTVTTNTSTASWSAAFDVQ